MGFDIRALIEARRGDAVRLHAENMNPQLPKVLKTLGFDRTLESADGPWYVDTAGERYLDFLSGFGVHALGHNHPAIRRALHDVLDAAYPDLIQFDTTVLPGLLAEALLARIPGMDRVYFGNSGTEAVEAALKFARRATGKPRILYCDHAFHGLTTGSLSVNGADEFRDGFDPLLPDTRIPFGDLEAIERELRRGDVAALIAEPIQGKGVYVAPPGYLAAAQKLLHDRGALLIVDEVQTGIARTGKFLAIEYDSADSNGGVQPDIITLAKALSGGIAPVSATLARKGIFEKVYATLEDVLVHDSTYAGNMLGMTAGLATLSVIDDEGLVANAEARGEQLRAGIREIQKGNDLIADVRGRGLMIGIEFGRPSSLGAKALWTTLNTAHRGLFAQIVVVPLYNRHRVLTQVAGDRMAVVKLLPPLTIGEAEVDYFLNAFADVMAAARKPNGLTLEFGKTLVKNLARRDA